MSCDTERQYSWGNHVVFNQCRALADTTKEKTMTTVINQTIMWKDVECCKHNEMHSTSWKMTLSMIKMQSRRAAVRQRSLYRSYLYNDGFLSLKGEKKHTHTQKNNCTYSHWKLLLKTILPRDTAFTLSAFPVSGPRLQSHVCLKLIIATDRQDWTQKIKK